VAVGANRRQISVPARRPCRPPGRARLDGRSCVPRRPTRRGGSGRARQGCAPGRRSVRRRGSSRSGRGSGTRSRRCMESTRQRLPTRVGYVVARSRIEDLLGFDPKRLRALRVVREGAQVLLELHPLLLYETDLLSGGPLVGAERRDLVLVDHRPDPLLDEEPSVVVGVCDSHARLLSWRSSARERGWRRRGRSPRSGTPLLCPERPGGRPARQQNPVVNSGRHEGRLPRARGLSGAAVK
jgi:hypothetical protein